MLKCTYFKTTVKLRIVMMVMMFLYCRRKDSSQVQGETQVSKTDFSEVAKTNDIIINPGSNKITLSAKVCIYIYCALPRNVLKYY